jgi:hypothetical protein
MTTVINITTQRNAYYHARKAGTYVYIGRHPHSLGPWGNKYTHVLKTAVPGVVRVKNREEAVRRHREDMLADPVMMKKIREELKDKVLGCWCHPLSCHGQTYAAIANGELK